MPISPQAMTDTQIRRAIAERFGWHIAVEDQYVWALFDPAGKLRACVGHVRSTDMQVDQAWDTLISLTQEEDHHVVANEAYAKCSLWCAPIIPDYPVDLNAAITLTIEGTKLRLEEWHEVGRPNSWLATYYSNPRAMGIGVWADTPARAICKAYLAYLTEVIDKQPAAPTTSDEDDEHVTFY